MKRIHPITAALVALFSIIPIAARQQAAQTGGDVLTLDTVFSYHLKSPGEMQWQADGSGYFMLEPSASVKGQQDLVRYDAASGQRSILVAADKLIPPGATAPLAIEQYDFSADGQQLLIFTNSARVWRSNTRGDYWAFDLKSARLTKLGGQEAKPSSLMFA